MRYKKRILPTNTNITTYFQFRNKIFSKMVLPDNRILVQIVHTWGDGEIMGEDWKFTYSDGKARSGINPLLIVRVYDGECSKKTLNRDLDKFLTRYENRFGGTDTVSK